MIIDIRFLIALLAYKFQVQAYVDDFLDVDENTIKKSIGYMQIVSKYLTTSPFDKLHKIVNCAINIS